MSDNNTLNNDSPIMRQQEFFADESHHDEPVNTTPLEIDVNVDLEEPTINPPSPPSIPTPPSIPAPPSIPTPPLELNEDKCLDEDDKCLDDPQSNNEKLQSSFESIPLISESSGYGKSTNNELVDLVKQQALEMLKTTILEHIEKSNTTINKQLLMKLLVICMESVEKTRVKGKDQKDVVIEAIISILKLDSIKAPNKNELILFLENYVDDVIDIVVAASKGNIDINKMEPVAKSFISLLFSCFSRNSKK